MIVKTAVGGSDVMGVAHIRATQEIGDHASGTTYDESSRHVIPTSDEGFKPNIEATGGYITKGSGCRTGHTQTSGMAIERLIEGLASGLVFTHIVGKCQDGISIVQT